ncbi:MAG: hypothetical protein QM790_18750 [Nibricoccus sp.]
MIRVIFGVLLIASAQVVIAAPADVLPPQRRAQTLELAAKLSKPATAEQMALPEAIRNPFNPAAETIVSTNKVTSDKDLVSILADLLQPTGVMGREDDLVLLRKGQKGVKVNDHITLSFDGSNYDVEITAIDQKNFSLRYNQAEITRPIKTGKNP